MPDHSTVWTTPISRRAFAASAFGVAIGGALPSSACSAGGDAPSDATRGKLAARPRRGITTSARGELELDVGAPRETVLRMPAAVSHAPLPLLVALHGAAGSARTIVRGLGDAADAAGIALLATSSRATTWDAIRGTFGVDVAALDRALLHVFGVVDVDPARIVVGGFSDGATYALSLGAINGDLFRRVLAFSPGFIVNGARSGNPAFFISHGTSDAILPIDQCSRRLVPLLRGRGYDVTYREFDGGHTVPAEIARDGMAWAARPTNTR